ncbi:hypothetical protein ACXM2N_05340 [Corynebacterium sp. ZY180755]
MCADSARRTTNDTPDLDGYVGWVVDDLKWGTLQDDLSTEEEAPSFHLGPVAALSTSELGCA